MIFTGILDDCSVANLEIFRTIHYYNELQIQLAAPSISKLLQYNPSLRVFDFPFLFKGINEVEIFYEKAKSKLFYPDAKDNNVLYLDKDEKYLVLGLWHAGMKQLSSSKEINISNDEPLAGQTFRIQNSPIIEFVLGELGAKVKIENNFAKVKKLLQKGAVDGQESTWSHIESEQFYEHQKYFVETNHGYLGYLLLTNKSFWEKLEKDESLKEEEEKQNQKNWLDMIQDVTSVTSKESNELNKLAKSKIEEAVKKGIQKEV